MRGLPPPVARLIDFAVVHPRMGSMESTTRKHRLGRAVTPPRLRRVIRFQGRCQATTSPNRRQIILTRKDRLGSATTPPRYDRVTSLPRNTGMNRLAWYC